jgi:hypothetical protein
MGRRVEGLASASDVNALASLRCQFKGDDMCGTARRVCKQMEIRVRPTNQKCGPMETHAINVIANLIKMHGMENMVVTLRILTESHSANRSQLNRNVITAVNDICRLRRFTDRGLALVEAFDGIDLGAMHAEAKAEPLSTIHNARTVLACKIINRLDRIFGPSQPSKPPARSKAKVVSDNLALGIALLRIKAAEPARFAAVAYELFNINPKGATVYRAMAAAKLYAGRPEITSRVSWDALSALSAPTLPTDARRKLEAAIVSGQAVRVSHISRARQAHAQRQPDQPAPRMAA